MSMSNTSKRVKEIRRKTRRKGSFPNRALMSSSHCLWHANGRV